MKSAGLDQVLSALRAGGSLAELPSSFYSGGYSYAPVLTTKRGAQYRVSTQVMRGVPGTPIGCGMGYQAGMQPPIRLSDGFIPCSVDRPVQFDFQPRRGMVGVTCSVTAEDMSAFEQRMAGAFGEKQRASDGSRRWQLGGYTVGSVEVVVLGKTLRRVSVYQD